MFDGAIEIANCLAELIEIDIINLTLNTNMITSVGAEEIFKSFCLLNKLTILLVSFAGNKLEDQGAVAISKYFEPVTSKSLKRIYIGLEENSITKEGGKLILVELDNI